MDESKIESLPPDYAILVEVEGDSHPVLQVNLSLGRLLDEIVIPHQEGKVFIVGGQQIEPGKSLRTLRIFRAKNEWMSSDLHRLHVRMGLGKSGPKTKAEYDLRIIGILNAHAIDITGQVLQVYKQNLKERITEWLPKRKELLPVIMKALQENLDTLG